MNKDVKLYSRPRRSSAKPKQSQLGINAGGAIIIIIFVVLCLTIFSVLSFASAYSDKKLSDKTKGELIKFGAAEMRMEHIIADFANYMNPDYKGNEIGGTGIQWAAESAVAQIDSEYRPAVKVTESETDTIVVFLLTYDDMHSLEAGLTVDSNNKYRITTWRNVITGTMDYDTGLNVWAGPDE